ncbi:TLD-domain-containing protein [Anaeromyces robustus]|uniref:Oxidation resistance protein 1 n=1 Tax=Anaeromyces robustus TaxID=1754192 RepID=A0A1Y1XB14_9FUNG|nr:TLD-domain-containing protein [Anaeromyces robustus]|eukprot:ORX82544.1 TLD-domain-containing protein [Anaeromyces robustus]
MYSEKAIPLPITNINGREHILSSASLINDENKEEQKKKEKTKTKNKTSKEKINIEKSDSEIMSKNKNDKEKEKEKKKNKKKSGKTDLQRTSSVIEIERRLKNVFDASNYQIKLLDREPGAHPILNNDIANKILPYVTPSAYREYRSWRLIYCLEYHGSNLQTMYDCVYERVPLITAIMDEEGYIFGAYTTEYFHKDTHYYGNGETFLWKYSIHDNSFKVFPSTGSNHYYIISEKNYLAFGGGKGFGLYINDDFIDGYSDNCETFNNEILSCRQQFKCINVEMWCLEL